MKIIAIIPARSGSKGIKDKNIKLLCGKPLIAWTIEAATNSKMFSEIMVSTDSYEYAEISRNYGANVPFMRSDELASDTAGSWDTVREVINNYKIRGKNFDAFCLLQPTSPLRKVDDIISGINLFQEKNANSVIGVCELEHSFNICNTIKDNLSMNGFFNSNESGRRQDMKKYYRINGALYIQTIKDLLSNKNLYGEGSIAYIMDKISSIDIDDEVDFVQAEALINKYRIIN